LIYYGKTTNLDDTLKRNIQNNSIFIIDDGLASGFTMLAAIKMIKKYKPKQNFISIPTAPLHTIKRLQKEVNKIFCPNIRDTACFDVADAYKHWYDVLESEIMDIINHSKFYYR
jgi:predicted phosphoribosyltransferase